MSQIIKAFTGVFMILLMVITTTGILGGYMQVLTAQNIHSGMIEELENSDYNPQVMRESIAIARQNQVNPTIYLYGEDGNKTQVQKEDEVPEKTDNVVMAEVIVAFEYKIPFLGIREPHRLSGYAH